MPHLIAVYFFLWAGNMRYAWGMGIAERNILIVDDDKVLSDLYRVKFERAGYLVHVAENGQKALEYLKTTPMPDIILLDVMMPVMTGFEFLQEAKYKGVALPPVIMLTNQQEEVDKMRSFAFGADHFIQKALSTPKDVLEKVEAILKDADNKTKA